MSDVDVSTSAGAGVVMGTFAASVTRTGSTPDPVTTRARGLDHFVLDQVNLSSRALVETRRAVGAVERTQTQGADSTTIRPRGPEGTSRSDAARGGIPVRNAVEALQRDVARVVRTLGGSDDQADRAERQLAARMAERLGEPPRADLDDGAGVSNWRGLEVWATGIEVVLDQDNGQVAVTYAGLGVGTRLDFLANAYPPSAAGKGDQPHLIDDSGRTVDPQTATRGLYVDLRSGNAGLSSSAPGGRGGGRTDGATASEGGYRGAFSPRAGGTPAFTLPPRMDENRDGAPDDKDTGFRSLLILRSGASTSPLAEAGLVRIQLDAAVPLRAAPEGTTSFDEMRRDGPVTPTDPTGL